MSWFGFRLRGERRVARPLDAAEFAVERAAREPLGEEARRGHEDLTAGKRARQRGLASSGPEPYTGVSPCQLPSGLEGWGASGQLPSAGPLAGLGTPALVGRGRLRRVRAHVTADHATLSSAFLPDERAYLGRAEPAGRARELDGDSAGREPRRLRRRLQGAGALNREALER
jgi:hypothetical protein